LQDDFQVGGNPPDVRAIAFGLGCASTRKIGIERQTDPMPRIVLAITIVAAFFDFYT
jgi:hypothetical protein